MTETIDISAWDLAARYIGIDEIPGKRDNPLILAMLRLDQKWPRGDEVPWCSAFINFIAWNLRLCRSKSLRARSWLQVGIPQIPGEWRRGMDVAIFSRGKYRPGPTVINAPGHVGFYTRCDDKSIYVLGGNQKNTVSVAPYPIANLLGVRRLHR